MFLVLTTGMYSAFSHPSKRRRPNAPGKAATAPDRDLHEQLYIGLTAELANAPKSARINFGKKPRAPRTKKADGTEKANKSKKDGGAKGKGGKKTRRGPTLTNLDSLMGRDVIADAQQNVGGAQQPTFSSKNKDTALKELIASVPAEARKTANVDKNALLKASKSFTGIGSMKSDGNGGWKLKG